MLADHCTGTTWTLADHCTDTTWTLNAIDKFSVSDNLQKTGSQG